MYRFHVVSEFDNSKRSCRRRLAGHNERRRKSSQDSVSRNPSQGNYYYYYYFYSFFILFYFYCVCVEFLPLFFLFSAYVACDIIILQGHWYKSLRFTSVLFIDVHCFLSWLSDFFFTAKNSAGNCELEMKYY